MQPKENLSPEEKREQEERRSRARRRALIILLLLLLIGGAVLGGNFLLGNWGWKDTTAPELTVDALPGSTANASIVVSGTVNDDKGIDGLILAINGAEVPVNADGSWSIVVILEERGNEFIITATDKAGNMNYETVRVFHDRVAPGLTVQKFVEGDTVTIVGRVEDEGKVTVTVNGEEIPVKPDGTFEITVPLEEGSNEIIIEATDEAGNITTEKVVVEYGGETPAEDTTPPVLTIEKIVEGDTVTIIGKVEDDGDGEITVTVNGEEIPVKPDGTFEITVPLEEGSNEIIIKATDEAGNTTTEKVAVEYEPVDTTAPTLTVNKLPSSTTNASIVVSGTVSDDKGIDGVTLTVRGVEVSINADGTWRVLLPLKYGNNTFEVVAVDGAGNKTSKTVSIFRKESEPVFEELVAEFSLFDEIYEADGVTVENDVVGDMVAPGTGGTFTVKFKNPVTAGLAVYSLELVETNAAGVFIQYSVDGNIWYDGVVDINAMLTDQPMNPSEEKVVTVYWRWAFEDGHDGQTDEGDTSLGAAAANGEAPSVIISITLTVTLR